MLNYTLIAESCLLLQPNISIETEQLKFIPRIQPWIQDDIYEEDNHSNSSEGNCTLGCIDCIDS